MNLNEAMVLVIKDMIKQASNKKFIEQLTIILNYV